MKEFSEDELFSKNSVVVLLNGFVHIDDRMTIRDITRQLKFESLVENKEFKSVAGKFLCLVLYTNIDFDQSDHFFWSI